MYIQPVFDRKQSDVDGLMTIIANGYSSLTAEEKEDWLNTKKGAINARDLNRIEGNIEELATILNITGMTFKTNWTYLDFFLSEDQRRILFNIKNILFFFGTIIDPDTGDAIAVPTYPLNDWEKLNDLEKIIYIVYERLQHISEPEQVFDSNDDYIVTSDNLDLYCLGTSFKDKIQRQLGTSDSLDFAATDGDVQTNEKI